MARARADGQDRLAQFRRKILKSVKQLANPCVAVAVVAVVPWLVMALLAFLFFTLLGSGS